MISKFLEAKVILNDKPMDIVNTQMDISVEYNCRISEEHLIYLNIDRVFGHFNYKVNSEAYTKSINLQFQTDDTWVIKQLGINLNKVDSTIYSVEPEMAVIDFDKKLVSVKF